VSTPATHEKWATTPDYGPAAWAIELVRKAERRVEQAEHELAEAELNLAWARRNLDIVAPKETP
jgi:hypothetical protein